MVLQSTMTWVYLAIALLAVLTVLLVGPYVGLYGTRNPAAAEEDLSTEDAADVETEVSAEN